MKTVFLLAACAVLVVVVTARDPLPRNTDLPSPPPSRRPRSKPCSSGEDCDADQCCIGFGFGSLRTGKCKKLGTEGSKCEGISLKINGKYQFRCPCASGLTCEPRKVIENIFGDEVRIGERCTASTATPEEVTIAP